MKISATTTAAAVTLALLSLLLIGWAEQAAAHPLSQALSPVLHNTETFQNVGEAAKEAQKKQDDPSVRLLPSLDTNQDHMKICCLHANILDFYLNNILPHHSGTETHMHRLRVDLGRISLDLSNHGCNVTHYHDHQHAVEFKRRFHKMEGKQRLNKAVSEVDILFSYLQDFCVFPSNTINTTSITTAN